MAADASIRDAYIARTPKARELAEQAAGLFPSGVTHDLRFQDPYPVYIAKASGPRKWDADGNEYIDYIGGHGALILGHCPPAVTKAVAAQAGIVTHPGAAHEWEVRWGEHIQDLMPSMERMRFTSSGTEATMLAYRLARSFTGKSKIVQFEGHFHGWQDHAVGGYEAAQNAPPQGILPAIAETGLVLEPGNRDQVEEVLTRDNDIAAIIVEPTGAHFGATPLDPDFLVFLREITGEHDCLLIFDEVVTGFRVATGGMQAVANVSPDLTTIGKIMAGGLPGGAVGGRADILGHIDFKISREAGRRKIGHPGTFNANPVSAAAGIASLTVVRDTDACAAANWLGGRFRHGLNAVLEDMGISWAVYGEYSGFHLFTNAQGREVQPAAFDPFAVTPGELTGNDPALMATLRLAMLVNGIDLSPRFSGFISAAHTEADIDATAASFRRALEMMTGEDIISP